MYQGGPPHNLHGPHINHGMPTHHWTERGAVGYPDVIRAPRPVEPPCSIEPPYPISFRPKFSPSSSSQPPVSVPGLEIATLNLPAIRSIPNLQSSSSTDEAPPDWAVRSSSWPVPMAQDIFDPRQTYPGQPDQRDSSTLSVGSQSAEQEPRSFRSPHMIQPINEQTTSVHSDPMSRHVIHGIDGYKTCIGRCDIPGEGPHYVYDDGSRCPMHVNGEYVHPEWGLTKAHKPRKRLRKACLNCRDKKIQCKPQKDGCLGCQKSKQPCLTEVTPEPY